MGCLQAETEKLKNSLDMEFQQIHSLCLSVLKKSKKQSLIRATLATLRPYLSWIPLGYIFESELVETLQTLFSQAAFRNAALQSFTEVCSFCPLSVN